MRIISPPHPQGDVVPEIMFKIMDDKLVRDLKKSYGDNITVEYGAETPDIEVIPTGSLEFDIALGIGGWAGGRISALAGTESSGKSTFSLKSIGIAQKLGKKAALIDTEHSFDPHWAELNGVNVDELMIIRPRDFETAAEASVNLADSGELGIIVFDSIAGSPLRAEVEGELSDANIGRKAKIMAAYMPKLAGPVSKNKVVMLCINQLRDPIGAYQFKPHMPGGLALRYQSSATVFMRSNKSKDVPGAVLISVTIEKNKLGSPFKKTEFIMGADGTVELNSSMANILVDKDYLDILGIEKGGAWYVLPEGLYTEGEPKFNGRGKIKEALDEDPEFASRVEEYIRSSLISINNKK